jgi:hypothetical protein
MLRALVLFPSPHTPADAHAPHSDHPPTWQSTEHACVLHDWVSLVPGQVPSLLAMMALDRDWRPPPQGAVQGDHSLHSDNRQGEAAGEGVHFMVRKTVVRNRSFVSPRANEQLHVTTRATSIQRWLTAGAGAADLIGDKGRTTGTARYGKHLQHVHRHDFYMKSPQYPQSISIHLNSPSPRLTAPPARL